MISKKNILSFIFVLIVMVIPFMASADFLSITYGDTWSGTYSGNWNSHSFSGYDSTADRSTYMKSAWVWWTNYVSGGKEDGCSPNDVATSTHYSKIISPYSSGYYTLTIHYKLDGSMTDYNSASHVKVFSYVQYKSGSNWYTKYGTYQEDQYSEFSSLFKDSTMTTGLNYYSSSSNYRVVLGFELSIGNSHCSPEGKINFYYGGFPPHEIILDYFDFNQF